MVNLIWVAVGVLALIGVFQLSHGEWSNAARRPVLTPAYVCSPGVNPAEPGAAPRREGGARP